MRRFVVMMAVMLAACGDSTGSGGGNEQLKIGRYAWTAAHGRSDGFAPQSFSGTMIVEAVGDGTATVRFSAPDMRPATVEPTRWQVDAWRIVGDPTTSGNLYHRVTRAGDSLRCTGTRTYFVDRSYSTPITCTLRYVGP
jgi:hypothetical protein